jgi:hypothetical protein
MTSSASFFPKKELRIVMPVFKYFAVVGSALLVFLFACDAYFGDDETNSRFNGSVYERSIYAPRTEEIVATEELRFTRDVTPAGRVKDVFDRFSLNEAKRGKRYLNTATVIR